MTERIIAIVIIVIAVIFGPFSSYPGVLSSSGEDDKPQILSFDTDLETDRLTDHTSTSFPVDIAEVETTSELSSESTGSAAETDVVTPVEISTQTDREDEIFSSPETTTDRRDVSRPLETTAAPSGEKQPEKSVPVKRTKTDHKTALANAVSYLRSNHSPLDYGSEWIVISLATAGYSAALPVSSYYSSVASTVAEKLRDSNYSPSTALDKNKATENARVILALLSIGVDPHNVGGYDLVSALLDTDWVCSGTLNCPIYALIALNACGTGNTDAKNFIVDYILSKQLPDGGWALSGERSDPDVTSMALQALSFHRSRNDVSSAASRAILALSTLQLDTGGFRSWGVVNSESISQVMIALCAWGIDPSSDSRFVKNGNSALDALLTYSIENSGFSHLPPDCSTTAQVNLIATEQATMAITAYLGYISGEGIIYSFN